jgi:hypothetical protein
MAFWLRFLFAAYHIYKVVPDYPDVRVLVHFTETYNRTILWLACSSAGNNWRWAVVMIETTFKQ